MNTKMNRSAGLWIWDFAGEYRSRYVLSVLSAVCGVICGILPYFVMANIIALPHVPHLFSVYVILRYRINADEKWMIHKKG